MIVRITAALILLLLINTVSCAQIFPAKNYPKGYFTWPVDAKKALVANFGELRPNHYHMGLDCRTDQKENRPVLAAADGYIAKVKIEPIGFGRCIYINHPNGLTTLYAHLNDFNPVLEKYVTEQQYKLQSWKVFLDIPANLFPVKKGQFIAYSGNTGGSQGPHTHFEIRDTQTDKVLNPLLFGLPVVDNIAPDILRLAVYDRNISTFEQSPRFYPLKKMDGVYTTSPHLLLTNTGKVSFAITAYDRYTGSTSRNGIYEAVLYEDEQPVCGFQLDSISYDETRYLNAHIDYKLRSSGGSYVQHLSRLPGYPPGVYEDVTGDGVINIEDDNVHQIKIEVKDAAGNTSVVQFGVQQAALKQFRHQSDPTALYQQKEFHPDFINVFENNHISFYLPENALYDSIRFGYKEIIPSRGYPIYQLQNGNIPVHCIFPVTIKNSNTAHPDKMVMHRFWKDKNDYKKAVRVTMGNENDWYKASFRDFGNFQLLEDTTAPSIIPIGIREGMNAAKLNRIAFVIKDNTKELENFTAYLDGKWLRFSNDKGSTFIYKFDEHCLPGVHELKISVQDCVGNRAERTYHFSR
ncbi:MAG: M23 family metallopeptidase [Ferruginibacter sp.]